MTTPLFKVGEKVVLQSKGSPQYNGVYYVHQIVSQNARITCRISETLVGYFGERSTPFGYTLDTPLKHSDGNFECIFVETALRKYQEPSDYSFDELMSELKNKDLTKGGKTRKLTLHKSISAAKTLKI